jgi:hypothetical protein
MIDGEECGTTPMRVTVIPHAVTVLVPAERVQEAVREPKADQTIGQDKMAAAVSPSSKNGDYAKGEITAFINLSSIPAESKPSEPPAKG